MYWGKVFGLLLGFVLGHSILGAVVGLIIGHWLDTHVFAKKTRRAASPSAGSRTAQRQAIFSESVVNLAAKMAKVDGVVTREEVDAFKSQFSIPPSQMAAVGKLYDEAKQDAGDYEMHARRLADAFPGEMVLLGEVLEALHRIALADGRLQPAERQFLERVATIFGFAPRSFAEHATELGNQDPYSVLGVARAAPMTEIKAAWRRLTREHHPDTLMAKGMPPEYIELATRKMATINAAYDSIRAERGEV
jgi:DnaJ like chaperone protein